jgi:hypothetical protein
MSWLRLSQSLWGMDWARSAAGIRTFAWPAACDDGTLLIFQSCEMLTHVSNRLFVPADGFRRRVDGARHPDCLQTNPALYPCQAPRQVMHSLGCVSWLVLRHAFIRSGTLVLLSVRSTTFLMTHMKPSTEKTGVDHHSRIFWDLAGMLHG